MSVGSPFADWLITSTLWLSFGFVFMSLVLWLTRTRQWSVHRYVWALVLLQGMVCGWITVRIPVVERVATQGASSANGSMIELLADRGGAFQGARPAEQAREEVSGSITPAGRQFPWRLALVVSWWTGLLTYWVATLARYVKWLRRLSRGGQPGGGYWRREWQEVLGELGVRQRARIVFHEELGPCVVWTGSGTALVVPREYWLSRTAGERRAIMEHEAGHLARRDLLQSFVVRALAALHWFNPCAWLCVRRWEEAAEWACDESVLRRDPRLATTLARVLLDLAVVSPTQLGVSSVKGARLSVRIRRLVSVRSSIKESAMKKWMIGLIALTLLVAGAVQIKLVARQIEEEDAQAERRSEVEWRHRLQDFAAQLATTDKLSARVKEQLSKPAAVIAVRDRVAGLAEEQRRQMRREAIPRFFAEHFYEDEQDGKLHWREGDDSFRSQFLAAVHVFQNDMESIHQTLSALADDLAAETELEKLAQRFLKHEEAPVVLYVEHVQKQLRPDGDFILRELGELFAVDDEYRYFIRAGRRDEAKQFVERALRYVELVPELRKEIQLYAKEFSAGSELDKQMKAALSDPLMPDFIATIMMRDFEGPPQEAINQFFEQLSQLAVDTGSGLSVVEKEAQDEVREVLREFARAKQQAGSLKGPLSQFVAKLRDSTDLDKQWKVFLKSEPALLFLASQFELPPTDAGAAARSLLAPALRKDEQGRLRLVAPEGEDEEEIMGHLRELFRQYRMIRLHTRPIEKWASRIDDQETAEALKSLAGRVLVFQEIERKLNAAPEDVWDEWVESRFEKTANGWVVRPAAREEIAEMLRDIEAIEEESAKDDF